MRLIIFDCDGVLVDSEPLACATVASGLRRLGIQVSTEEVLARYTGISAPAMYADLQARHGMAVSAEQRAEIDRSVENALAAQVQAMPGVNEALAELGSRCALCVASSSSPSRIAASLKRAGLAAYFGDHVFSAFQVARGKPAPDLFLHAAAAMQADPSQCLVIEDSVAGTRAAMAAKMPCLGFVGGGHATPALATALADAGAFEVFADMKALPALVR